MRGMQKGKREENGEKKKKSLSNRTNLLKEREVRDEERVSLGGDGEVEATPQRLHGKHHGGEVSFDTSAPASPAKE